MKTYIEDFTGRNWLFELIDNWLTNTSERFFILTGESGVGISSISTQLIQRSYITAYHFCQAGDVETTKSSNILRSLAIQLGNLPNYGQALATTVKPLDLLSAVNSIDSSMTESQITQLYIDNLAPNDPENELEILIRRPLTILQPQPTNIVILIDSLYEAAITGDENIIRLFAQLSNLDLPSFVRFILTSRPRDPLLREFSTVTPYYIENTSQKNQADIWQYVEERLKQPDFQNILDKAPVTSGTLSSQIVNWAKGNFLYTKLLIDNIVTQEFIDNTEALPKCIDDIYHSFLNNINIDERQNYQYILGVLSAAQQPLTQEQLINFTRIESIFYYLDKLNKFLYIENETYCIFHQSLRDYLLDKKRSGEFWCDASFYHNLIIQHYQQDTTWEEVDFQKFDNYGLLYLVRHLDAARRVEEVNTLLTSSSKWMEAKFNAFSNNASYIDDLELAINKFPKLLQPDQLRMLMKRYVALRNIQAGTGKKRENHVGGQRCMFFIEEEAPKL
ncbi:hypothetical protein DSM106972_036330 [Dulcicalothrix desertica PCC 7102]|uniref:Orc1-like AAA ATPase domain-containing protein n=1 Tax=Dulcicalothrix desertica PCC 7102 TaxID=232991 RepID=A0A433VHV0_9CYAN|nr:hypothetical protein [Dulcicalothrix desertica]RUT05626.1 hypothetical protein DSM106972_036330 [Dulcicalothrix desertica PCC 7102]TWH54723.1 hypothetical protein CAL7102_02776 [Dulcicalothrix desertica PCC 7102]